MRRPLPTARQMPTSLKTEFELESTMPAADVLADAVADVVEEAEIDEDMVRVHVRATEKAESYSQIGTRLEKFRDRSKR